MASHALKDFKCTLRRQAPSAARRAVLCLHVVHLKSFNARLAVDYPLLI